MADDSLFRKAALDKLASPERLDVLMQVTTPRDRIAAWTIAGLVLAVLAWAVFSKQPDRLGGKGAIQQGGGAQEIVASGDGSLSEFLLTHNQVVRADQVVGKVSSVSTAIDVQSAQQTLDELRRQSLSVVAAAEQAISEAELERGRRHFELSELKRRYAEYELDVKRGDKPAKVLLQLKQEMSAIESRLTQIASQIAARRTEIQQSRAGVQKAEIELKLKGKTAQAASDVISPIDGRVVDLRKKNGELVRKGEVLAQVVPLAEGEPLNIVAFVSAQLGQRIRQGQPVQVVVNGIKTEDAGFMRGLVAWVSSSYATPGRVAEVMQESLPDPVYEVHIAPVLDETTVSGYAWSTRVGPQQRLDGGSFVNIQVEVGTYAPISRLPATLKGLFGV